MATKDTTKATGNGAEDPKKAAGAAAEQPVEDQVAELGIEVTDAPFTMELSDDQRDIQEWAHGFAERTIRPAAA
ncbi:MAG: hypothetical protein AABM29_10585, partial [Actinomycetota bacterium]